MGLRVLAVGYFRDPRAFSLTQADGRAWMVVDRGVSGGELQRLVKGVVGLL